MRRAVPIETVREYVDDQYARAEAAYENARDPAPNHRNPEWSRVWTRFAWLHWLAHKALRRAERAGVGAVLSEDTGPELLEQLALLGEQLHAQNRIVEPYGTAPVGTVPRDLTADAVAPYWAAATVLSASAEGWRRYPDGEILASRVREKRELDAPPAKARAESDKRALIGLEHRLRLTLDAIGGFTATPGLETVHGHVQRAFDNLGGWRWLYDHQETDESMLYEQLDRARASAYAAVGACREAGNPVAPDELQSIADAIQDACRQSLECRLWEVNKALGGSNPHRGVEAVHHQAERAACHVAAARVLRHRGVDDRERIEQAREAAHAAVAACPADGVPALDRVDLHEIANELGKIAEALDAYSAAE
jgi:hypothetical protein